jgi:hypothetical protein
MQARHFLPVFILAVFLPFLVKSQCSFSANIGADATVCKGSSKTLTVATSGGTAPLTYTWSVGSYSPTISVNSVGNYSVIVTDANGCIGKDTMAITAVLDTSNFVIEIRTDTASFLSCNNKNLILKAQPDPLPPVFDFTWSTGATAQQFITVSEPGTYAVTVTAVNGCQSRNSIKITRDTTSPQVSISALPSSAVFNCYNNQVILDVSSTTPGVTFTWNTGQTNTAIAAMSAGTYTATAHNAEYGGGNGCTASAQVNVKNGIPLVSLGADITINTGQTATLTATVTRGVGPFSYNWSNGLGNNPSVSVSLAGDYYVTVTDPIGCSSVDTIKVTVLSNALIVNAGADATTCKNVGKTLSASVSNGVAPYSYLWSTGATSPTVLIKYSGSFVVTVTDATGATGKDTVAVTALDTSTFELQVRPDTALFLSCNNKNLILKAQPDGAIPVANFTWNTGANSLQFITVYETGTYAVTVTAVNGCTSSSSVVVTKDITAPNVSILPVPISATLNCNTPQVILDAISTTPSVTFTWNTGAVVNAISVTTAGFYTVTASNPEFGGGNGCKSTATVEVKNSTPSVNLGPDKTITSGQSATLTAAISSGVAPFTYAWSNGLAGVPSVSVTNSGTYTVTITDANGCTATDAIVVTVSVNNSLIVNAGADATTCKNVAKTFTASVANGVAPYQYLWSNAATTASISVKNAGNYTVTVTDATGATGSDLVVLSNLDTSTFELQVRPDTALFLSCNNKNLILKAQPDGAIPVANFTWNTGANSLQFITVYETGTYAVTVTAVNGCTSSSSVVVTKDITAPNVSILPVPISATLNCNTPQVILDAISTTPSVTFTWNTGAVVNAIPVTTAGFYTVTASNPEFGGGNGCKSTATVEVKNTTPSVNLGPDKTITSGQTATLTAAISSGVAPFTYAWSNGLAGVPSVSVTNSGTYTVTITDATGCTATDAIVVTVTTSACTLIPSVSVNNAYCFGSITGAIFIGYVSGGVAPYQYSFDGGLTFSTDPNRYNIAAGNYNIVVKDAGNCTGSKTVAVTEGPKINFTATPLASCNGLGSITISNVSGGNGSPFQYAITNLPLGHPFANAWVTTTVFNNLPPNTYFVKVRDISGCSNQPPIAVVLGSGSGISATISGNSTVCFSGTTALTASATGGLAPYTYAWIKPDASSSTSQILQGGVGNFFVTVTDANGCVASATKTVTGVNGVTAAITGNTALCTSASTTLTATGWEGTPPYNFTWSTGKTGTANNTTTGVAITVGAGNYCVTVTDANGCSSTLCKTVTASTLAATVSSSQNGCSGLPTTLTATPSFGLAPYAYSWSNGNTTNAVSVGTGNYTVTITDAGGCTLVKTTTVAPSTSLTLTLGSTDNIKCNGTATGKIVTSSTGGSGVKAFTINNFATTQTSSTFANLAIGTYTIQMKDGNGCLSNTVSATLTQAAAIGFTASKINVSCNGASNGTITVYANGGVAPLMYSRDNGSTWQTSATFTGLSVGNVNLKVRDANNCTTAAQTVTLTQPTVISFATIKDDPTCNSTTDGKITVRFVSGGNGGPYLFSKDNGGSWQTDSIFPNLSPATYLIKVRDYYSCPSAARTIVVAQPAAITFATTVGDVTCGFTSNGVIGINNVAGGVAPYQYSGGGAFQTSASFTGLAVNAYPMRVKDAKGCLSTIKNVTVINSCTTSPLIQAQPTQRIPIVIARVSPNPAVEELQLEVRSLNDWEQQFNFIDAFGKILVSEKRALEAGINRLSFDVSALPQGTYFIQTPNTPEGKGQPRKFVKL